MPDQGRYRTGDQALVRQMNLSVIMHYLREHGAASRASLAEATGLNKTTVSSLVRELTGQGFIHEVGTRTLGPGRPGVLLRLNPAAGCILASEIMADFVSVVRTDFSAQVVWRQREPIDQAMGQCAIIDRTLTLLHQALDAEPYHELLGVALGVPGLVDRTNGTLLFAPNLHWNDVPLRAILNESFSSTVFVDNEANLAVLGEHYFGAARHCDDVLYLTLGAGVGGGLLRGGQLCRGASGYAGEFGHMTIDANGALCNCGNRGCWETLVSQWGLFGHVRSAMQDGRASRLGDMTYGDLNNLTVAIVVDAARAGDRVAQVALEQVGFDLGTGIASLVNALNPELVVLGGSLILAGEFLLPIAEEQVRRRALRWSADATRIVLAQQGADACVMGGIAASLQAVLAQPGDDGAEGYHALRSSQREFPM